MKKDEDGLVIAAPATCLPSHRELGRVIVFRGGQGSNVLVAHKNAITYLALNEDGTILATTSEVGTLIRVFNTQNW